MSRAGAVTRWRAEWVWLGGPSAVPSAVPSVVLEASDGVLVAIEPGGAAAGAVPLRGLVLPGLVNAHSHAFHRALRGRAVGADFWQWRNGMYGVAARLDPGSYQALATACYAEMLEAGITSVSEFHYLHQPGEMDDSVVVAARQSGIGLVLLDACYLRAGFGNEQLAPVQQRFSDGSVDAWAGRASEVARRHPDIVVGAAIHSVRAVDERSMATVGEWAAQRSVPLHLHLSEQLAENAACQAATGRTPAQVAADAGVLGPATTAVHATHVSAGDRLLLGSAATTACLCPTTERDLADGVGPAAALAAAGCRLALGSDSQAVIDLFEEARAVELDERLITGVRGAHEPTALLTAATGGRALAVGSRADFLVLSLDSARLAGFDPEAAAAHVVSSATASDVTAVYVGGRATVADGRHQWIDTAAALRSAIGAVTGRA
ncbi:MAG: formimidoylglutamate deiminase [Actinomycetota bacterium]|nr:formimidoylglutamate deiminase [Actinomycetota bacterium]